MLKYLVKSSDKAALDEYDQKSHSLWIKKAWINELLTHSRRKDNMMIKIKTLLLDQTRFGRCTSQGTPHTKELRHEFSQNEALEICCPCHLTVASEYFFNNDLEYLKSLDPEKKYTTSITKTKAARYELVGIEDMILNLWSVTKVGYEKDVAFGIKHWVQSVDKLHGYGYLEEIVVRRVDRQLYKFKEGKSHHQEESRRCLIGCGKLPEEAQHHKASKGLSWNFCQRAIHTVI
nr:hypothetical protein [Tanacetum cinerariifolium]